MRVKVWDLPTRLFHWLLAAFVIALVVTGRTGGDVIEWHARLGYCVAALLLFRIFWGFAGGHWSRFANFRPAPMRAWRYLRGGEEAWHAGHNPLGALSVYAMLLFLLMQVGSGLFASTKEDFAGPLAALVSNDASRLFTRYHKDFGQFVLIALVVLHVAAVGWYFRSGRNLVGPMITGSTEVDAHIPASRDDAVTRMTALVLLVACAAVVSWVVGASG